MISLQDSLAELILRALMVADEVLGSWVDLEAAEPLTSNGSELVDVWVTIARGMAEVMVLVIQIMGIVY